MAGSFRKAWALQAIPFGLVALLAIARHPQPDTLRPVAEQHLPGPLRLVRCGTDRAGAHLAVLAGDGQVHLPVVSHGQPGGQVLPLPSELREVAGDSIDLVLLDTNHDELLDVVACERRWGVSPLRSAVAVQTERGFGPFQMAAGLDGRGAEFAPTEVVDARGESYALAASEDGQGATRVTRRRDGRVRGMLRGAVVQCADLDGDGGAEVVTVQDSPAAKKPQVFRVYRFAGGHLGQVWQASFASPGRPHPDPYRATVTNRAMARALDIDHDGQIELAIAEGRSGRLTIWRWRSPE